MSSSPDSKISFRPLATENVAFPIARSSQLFLKKLFIPFPTSFRRIFPRKCFLYIFYKVNEICQSSLIMTSLVHWARWGQMLAPDWSRANWWRHVISGEGNHWPVGKNRTVGSYNRKSRGLRWETADKCEKRIVGSRWIKNRGENAGSKVQSPIWGRGGGPWSENHTK